MKKVFLLFYWSIVDLQCCINFWCTAEWFSCSYIYIFFLVFFSIVVCQRVLNIVPCAIQPGEGNGTPLQYSCLENPMDGEAWWAAVHGVARSRTRLSDFPFTFHFHALEKEMATHCSCLENSRDGGAWWASVYGVSQSRTRLKRLSSSSSSCTAGPCY